MTVWSEGQEGTEDQAAEEGCLRQEPESNSTGCRYLRGTAGGESFVTGSEEEVEEEGVEEEKPV